MSSVFKKYKSIPTIKHAVLLTEENADEIVRQVRCVNKRYPVTYNHQSNLFIVHTLEGNMIGNIGDYLIRGINDEYYPCKPDIFEKSYEEIKNGG